MRHLLLALALIAAPAGAQDKPAATFEAGWYVLSRTGYDQRRSQFGYYDAGLMMYVRDADRAKLTRDIRAFIRAR
jgi:hypothetical protein